MHTWGFVLIPYSVGVEAIETTADNLLSRHSTAAGGRFDYFYGTKGCFDDKIAEGYLPAKLKRSLHKRICEIERLPKELIPAALVTPDGQLQGVEDFGWRMVDEERPENQVAVARWRERFRELIASNSNSWVIEFAAHS